MGMIQGEKIKLRALEPTDLDFLYRLENNTEFWEYGHTQTPLSKFVLKQYLENSHRDIYDVKQLRLVITDLKDEVVGLIDFFDFDPKNKRVGLSIIIEDSAQRRKGFALEAIQLVCVYAFKVLDVHQVYAHITPDNEKSIKLFEKSGFKKSGTKKDWNYFGGEYKDEVLFQLFNSKE
jgi:diamine N-acetyltransferase